MNLKGAIKRTGRRVLTGLFCSYAKKAAPPGLLLSLPPAAAQRQVLHAGAATR
jgi:hypothetical protein